MNKRLAHQLKPTLLVGLLAGAVHAAPTTDWNSLFPHASPTPSIQLSAHYRDESGQSHQLTLERHADEWLHKRTDGVIDLYARRDAQGEVQIRLLDSVQHKVIDAKRSGLYQVGIFQDWAQLSTQLGKPKQDYQIESASQTVQTRLPCHWVQLQTAQDQHFQICWSADWNTVISLRKQQSHGDWSTLFEVDHLTTRHLFDDDWPSVPQDYQFANIDEDLQAD